MKYLANRDASYMYTTASRSLSYNVITWDLTTNYWLMIVYLSKCFWWFWKILKIFFKSALSLLEHKVNIFVNQRHGLWSTKHSFQCKNRGFNPTFVNTGNTFCDIFLRQLSLLMLFTHKSSNNIICCTINMWEFQC